MRLFYNVENQGDGSVAVHFHSSQAAAEKAEAEHDEGGEGWAESSCDAVELKIEGAKLSFLGRDKRNNDKWFALND